MPRTGPRPYECVKRAWHSERHQPIRGTIIQEIFRVVNQIHCPQTKKNREWQDKLPSVVLRAEEIMYSKANSEAEYINLSTLWDRANDAINTIIRRDESAETGCLLQPCIEAALNVGCMPWRASRSQRINNPRFYLSPCVQEPARVSSGIEGETTEENVTHLGLESGASVASDTYFGHKKISLPFKKVPSFTSNQSSPVEAHITSNICAVYPLYHMKGFQAGDPDSESSSKAINPAETCALQNLLSSHENASGKRTKVDPTAMDDHPSVDECDLSLRLSPLSAPCGVRNGFPQQIGDLSSNAFQDRSKFCDQLIKKDRQFLSFRGHKNEPLDMCSGKWNYPNENLSTKVLIRKRKAIANHGIEDRQLLWQPSISGRMRNADL